MGVESVVVRTGGMGRGELGEYLGAALEGIDELLGEADGCFARGMLIAVQLRI